MMKSTTKLMGSLIAAPFLAWGVANAAVIDVTSYDIENTKLSGAGGWSHTYDGTITADGLTYDYTGGSGTLNDGLVGTSAADTHLFEVQNNSAITLHLGESSMINTLSLFSYGPTSNGIPGNITGLDITINGVTEYFMTTGFGPSNAASSNNGRDHSHELVDLSGSLLAGLVTDTIMLSGFTTENPYAAYYSISEVTVDGAASVPEPSSLALMGLGMLGFGFARRKNRKA